MGAQQVPEWSGVVLGGEDFNGEVSIVVRKIDGESMAVLVPRGIARLGDEGHELMHDIQSHVMQLRELSEQLDLLVERARVVGMSWASIGFCVGTTGEAARQRWGGFDD